MMIGPEALRLGAVFGKLPDSVLSSLADCAVESRFEPSRPLVAPDAPPAVHLILEGFARRSTVFRGAECALEFPGSGDLVGTRYLLGNPSREDVVVAIDRVRAATFAPRELLALGGRHPEIVMGIASVYARRLSGIQERALAATTETVSSRLGQLLLEFVAREDRHSTEFVALPHRLTHSSIAQAVGASRPYTTVMISELVERGALRRGVRMLYVRPALLQEISSGSTAPPSVPVR